MIPTMSTAAEEIARSLNMLFAPMDAKVLADSLKWAQGRQSQLLDFRKSVEYQAMPPQARYDALLGIAGSRTWYTAFTSGDDLSPFVEKDCKAVSSKRNATIAAKLVKAAVVEVVSETYTQTSDGFDGVFVVNTDKGQKTVIVNTIFAGGHNIQRAHLRVLVKVK